MDSNSLNALPSLLVSEKDDSLPVFDPEISFPETQAALAALKKQNEELVRLRKRIEISEKLKSASDESLYEIMAYESDWEEALRKIESLVKEERFKDAIEFIVHYRPKTFEHRGHFQFEVEKEAGLIRPWLLCRVTSLYGRKLEENGECLKKEEAEKHYQRCLALPDGLERDSYKDFLVDESKGFLYELSASELSKRPISIGTFLSYLPYWRLALDGDPKESERTANKKAHFLASILPCYDDLGRMSFVKERSLEDALTLFRLRDLFPREKIGFIPFRYAYDENEMKLYFCESEAIESGEDEYRASVKLYVENIQKGDELSFLVVAHLLSLPGLDKGRFLIAANATKPLNFEEKVRLLSSSIALGMEPRNIATMLEILSKTRGKKGNLEAMSKPLLFIKEHLNDALSIRFAPLLENLLRSPKAHKIAVKSHDPALRALFGESQDSSLPPLGEKMKNSRVRSWGKNAWFSYLIFGIAFPIVLILFSSILLYCYSGIPATHASFYSLLPFGAALALVLSHIYVWFGRDERGSANARSILLADALWKAVVALAYFASPKLFPGLNRLRYTFIIASSVEAIFVFFYLKPTKKSAILDYFLFGTCFILCAIAVVFIVLDMMGGLL